jgi:hypothetical protein
MVSRSKPATVSFVLVASIGATRAATSMFAVVVGSDASVRWSPASDTAFE